jgi:hypothetical protein
MDTNERKRIIAILTNALHPHPHESIVECAHRVTGSIRLTMKEQAACTALLSTRGDPDTRLVVAAGIVSPKPAGGRLQDRWAR